MLSHLERALLMDTERSRSARRWRTSVFFFPPRFRSSGIHSVGWKTRSETWSSRT